MKVENNIELKLISDLYIPGDHKVKFKIKEQSEYLRGRGVIFKNDNIKILSYGQSEVRSNFNVTFFYI